MSRWVDFSAQWIQWIVNGCHSHTPCLLWLFYPIVSIQVSDGWTTIQTGCLLNVVCELQRRHAMADPSLLLLGPFFMSFSTCMNIVFHFSMFTPQSGILHFAWMSLLCEKHMWYWYLSSLWCQVQKLFTEGLLRVLFCLCWKMWAYLPCKSESKSTKTGLKLNFPLAEWGQKPTYLC